ncbi:MAG: hypothetical protein EAY72_04905 [Bacteroidetes bacterium]|nr:MAG: hypothetical protein EAY72_04905 [Bacteroidota bacterium]
MKYTLVIFLLVIGCKPDGKFTVYDINSSKYPWINAFKDQFFFSALREAYKGDTSIMNGIERLDALNPYDGLELSARAEARQLAVNFIKNLPPPAMCENCEPGENYYMATTLHYYASKHLDKIAWKSYRKHNKQAAKVGLFY